MPAKPAPIGDPYLTLGLEPGASMADVKRAYRRLAKAFHPDSAGERAIPHFLAIQAAYDQIRTGRVTLGGSRAGRGASAAGPGPASEPWRADPERARAARERARAGDARKRSGAAGTAGAASGTGAGGAHAGERRATGASGTSGTSGTTGGGSSGTGASTGTRRRATRKATMGSTSYDEARDPADATWSGASWYGPSTGEYWIVNPREYADPRKHGPDYQQRARRPAVDPVDEPAPAPAPIGAPDDASRPVQREAPLPRTSPHWSANASESGSAPAGEARPAAPGLEERATAPLRWLGDPTDDPVRRFGLALVAWPPIGLAAAALIGDATGCATFGVQCDGADAMLPWLAQAVILGLLLLLPPLTRILATGTIAVLVGLVPVTAFLLAVGASGAPQAAPVLVVLLGAVWLVGVAWTAGARLRRARTGT